MYELGKFNTIKFDAVGNTKVSKWINNKTKLNANNMQSVWDSVLTLEKNIINQLSISEQLVKKTKHINSTDINGVTIDTVLNVSGSLNTQKIALGGTITNGVAVDPSIVLSSNGQITATELELSSSIDVPHIYSDRIQATQFIFCDASILAQGNVSVGTILDSNGNTLAYYPTKINKDGSIDVGGILDDTNNIVSYALSIDKNGNLTTTGDIVAPNIMYSEIYDAPAEIAAHYHQAYDCTNKNMISVITSANDVLPVIFENYYNSNILTNYQFKTELTDNLFPKTYRRKVTHSDSGTTITSWQEMGIESGTSSSYIWYEDDNDNYKVTMEYQADAYKCTVNVTTNLPKDREYCYITPPKTAMAGTTAVALTTNNKTAKISIGEHIKYEDDGDDIMDGSYHLITVYRPEGHREEDSITFTLTYFYHLT